MDVVEVSPAPSSPVVVALVGEGPKSTCLNAISPTGVLYTKPMYTMEGVVGWGWERGLSFGLFGFGGNLLYSFVCFDDFTEVSDDDNDDGGITTTTALTLSPRSRVRMDVRELRRAVVGEPESGVWRFRSMFGRWARLTRLLFSCDKSTLRNERERSKN